MKTKKRVRSSLPWIGFALLVLAALYLVVARSGKHALEDAQSSLERAGRPTSMAEIVPKEIPVAENAALDYATAAHALEREATGSSDLLSELNEAAKALLENPANREALEEFRRLYQSDPVREALAVIERGSRRNGYWNDLDFSKGAAMELPHLQNLRRLSTTLAAAVRLQVADGDHAGAWQTAVTALRLANALENEPVLISQLVRANSIRRALDSMRELDFSAAPASQLGEVGALLTRLEDPAPFVAALDVERLIVGEQFFNTNPRHLSGITQAPGAGALMYVYSFIPPLRQFDRAAYLNALGDYAEAMAEPWSPSDTFLDARVMEQVSSFHLITRLAAPAIGSIKPRMISMFAEARVFRAGLAAIEYHLQHGTYPADLAVLGRDDLADPFTGNPLVYRLDEAGFSIRSLGPDLLENIGENAPENPDDIVWRYSENPQ